MRLHEIPPLHNPPTEILTTWRNPSDAGLHVEPFFHLRFHVAKVVHLCMQYLPCSRHVEPFSARKLGFVFSRRERQEKGLQRMRVQRQARTGRKQRKEVKLDNGYEEEYNIGVWKAKGRVIQ